MTRSLLLFAAFALASVGRAQAPTPLLVIVAGPASPASPIGYGIDRLVRTLQDAGLDARVGPAEENRPPGRLILVGRFSEERIRTQLGVGAVAPAPEGFILATDSAGALIVAGADDAGALYGCLELARRSSSGAGLPASVSDAEAPAFRVRAAYLGPGRVVDRDFWEGYLDFLAENRLNTLYVWGAPAEAVLVHEGERRGIAVRATTTEPNPTNLDPFRYGAQRSLQLTVRAQADRSGAQGIRLAPLDLDHWPNSADRSAEPLLQYQRDWIWYEAWARYAWNPDIPEAADHAYWLGRLGKLYGTAAAEGILAAYNDAGECEPRILRRLGIAPGDRRRLFLGVSLDELLQAGPAGNDASPPPDPGLRDILHYAGKAELEIDAAAPLVSANAEEFGRLLNDVHCIRELSLHYAAKAQAATLLLRYGQSHDLADLDQARVLLGDSLDHFRTLAQLMGDTYQGAEALPARLPPYEKELADLQARLTVLKGGTP